MKLVVADSSPLIALASSGHIDVLLSLIQEVVIPETVFQECITQNDKPGAQHILNAVRAGHIQRVDDPDISAFRDIDDLDIGEACAISLAITLKSAILIDDFIGREVAKAHRVNVIGGCGILLIAKQRGLIVAVKPVIDAWKDGIGYRLSDALIADVLRKAGEIPSAVDRNKL
jgi:predicted nucleic acid-binding protein